MGLQIRQGRLRTRIIAWSFVPTAIILFAVALVTFYAYQRVTEELVIGRNRELIRLSASQLVADLSNYVDLVTPLTHTSDIYEGDPQRQAAALKNSGNRLVVLDGGVVVLNQLGRVTAAQPERPELVGHDWSNRSYFRQIVRNRGMAFSDIIADGPQGADVIAIAVPILDPQEEFRGVLVGMFQLGRPTISAFYGGIVKLRIGESGNTFLVDSQGRVIYHTDTDRIGSDRHTQPVVQSVMNRQSGVVRTTDLDGNEILASFAPVPGTPWGLVNEENWAALLESSRGYGQFLLFLLALGVVVPTLVVMFGVRRITDPIQKLIAAAKEVAGGKFDQQITVRTGDELEELVKQFNLMSAQLLKSYTALKEREEQLELVMRASNDGIFDWDLRANEVYLSPRWKQMLGYEHDEGINWSEELTRLVHPDDMERVNAEVKAQENSPLYRIEYRLRHGDGSYRWILARGIALRDENGKVFRVAGSHTDITERKAAQEALRIAYQTMEQRVEERTHELDRRRQVAETLRDVLTILNSRRSLDEILDYIVAQACRLLGCDAIALYELDRETNLANIRASRGLDAEYVSGMAVPMGIGAVGRAIVQRQPIVLQDSGVLLTMVRPSDLPPQRWALLEGMVKSYRSLFAVPLIIKDEPYGAVALYYSHTRGFTEEDIALVVAFADQAALAIENAALRAQTAKSAVAAERDRMARELHDSVTQSIYSVNLYAEAAARLLTNGQHLEAADHLRELRDTAQEALREMRLLIFELRPLALEKSGLIAALRARLDAVEARGGMQADLQVEGAAYAEQLPSAVQEELYHIIQEALNNVLKHADAAHVWIRLRFQRASAYVEVADDGIGFAPEQAGESGGFGLSGMQERVQKIGGKLRIQSTPGKGTRVSVELTPEIVERTPSVGGTK